MAKKGDGWLSREISGYVGRWVAKKTDGWINRRWVAKQEMGG